MVCPKCDAQIEEGTTICPYCDYTIVSESESVEKQSIRDSSKMNVWQKSAIVSFFLSLVCVCMGFYKMYVYDEYDYINAYVGGDAYNYIINGTYATAFFVLATMFMIGAIGCVIIYYLSKN